MPRQLKTFVTNLGFFELAIAAPSMKAALEAWGMSHNAFAHGFAKQTGNPEIIAAATARPGVVLKRAVGSSGAFREDAELPKSLPNIKPPATTKQKVKKAPPPRPPARAKPKSSPADIISFENARQKREREREKKQAQEEAEADKQRAARRRATQKAQAALDKQAAAHQRILDTIEEQRDRLDRQAEKESARWQPRRKKLEQAVERAKGH